MDCFHLYCRQLDQLPNREEAYIRRGIACTFDADAVLSLIKQPHQSKKSASETIFAPGFDHSGKDPIERAIEIKPETNIVIMEGNWLLYDVPPWSAIHHYVDDSWFVEVDPALARNRVAKRHFENGVEETWEAAVKRVEANDLPNWEEARKRLIAPAVRVESGEVPTPEI
jgi:pantothenate kinase